MATILLAEDSPTHSTLIRSLLETESHQVTCVTNGVEAMKVVQSSLPDLVITDLRMPEMNGQELVQEITSQTPELPSIVVTARGSEALAVDALALGAANFVPKNSLNLLLNSAVRQTLWLSKVDALYRQSPGIWHHPEFSLKLSNDVSAIGPAVSFVVQSLAASGSMNPTQRIRVGTAVASAVFNAICYGNLEVKDDDPAIAHFLAGDAQGTEELKRRAAEEAYQKRSVELKISIGDDDTRILVAHNGRGRMTRMTPAPGTPESFELEQCRGLMLMTSVMDDVTFHTDYSEVVMVKQHVC